MNHALKLLIVVAVTALSGCAQPLTVGVLDRDTGKAISGATVTHGYVAKPYFITGTVVEKTVTTDAEGYAKLRDRIGRIEVDAPGYESIRIAGTYGSRIWLWLTPTKPTAGEEGG